MVFSITHRKVSAIPATTNTNLVTTADWDDTHVATGLTFSDVGGTISASQVGSVPSSVIAGTIQSSQITGNFASTQITGTFPSTQIVGSFPSSMITGSFTVPQGGTGQVTLTSHSVLLGQGTSAITGITGNAGTFLTGNTSLVDPSFSPTPTLGVPSSVSGSLSFATSASTAIFTLNPSTAAVSLGYLMPTASGTLAVTSQITSSNLTYTATAAGATSQTMASWLDNVVMLNSYSAGGKIVALMNVLGAANAAGLIRIQVASTATLLSAQIIVISGVTGTTEANGTWSITVIDATHFDLQTSVFVNAYIAGGSVGQTNDTTEVQSALNAAIGKTLLVTTGTYYVDRVQPRSGTTIFGGGGTFREISAAGNTFECFAPAAVSNIRFQGVNFYGTVVAANKPYGSPQGRCCAIVANACTEIYIENCRFENFLFSALDFYTCTNIVVSDNYAFNNASGLVRFTDCTDWVVDNNIIDSTALWVTGTTPLAVGNLAAGITMGGASGPSRHFMINNNVIKHLGYSQAIFSHSAQIGAITGNKIDDCSMGIYVAPAGGSSVDAVGFLTITGNQMSGIAGSTSLPTDSDQGITADGNNIAISGNMVSGFNTLSRDGANGGISVATGPVSVSGNTVQGCYGAGISMKGSVDGVSITGNTINSIVGISSYGPHQYGILSVSSIGGFGSTSAYNPIGIISGNTINHINSSYGIGIRFTSTSAAPTVLYSSTQSGAIMNKFNDVTIESSPA